MPNKWGEGGQNKWGDRGRSEIFVKFNKQGVRISKNPLISVMNEKRDINV